MLLLNIWRVTGSFEGVTSVFCLLQILVNRLQAEKSKQIC